MKLTEILMEGVKWKSVPGYPGYDVSNTGDIRNTSTQKILAKEVHYGSDKTAPYLRVQIVKDGKKKHLRISRAVAYAFLGNPPAGATEVDHINGDRSNNNVRNLEWVTSAENQRRKREAAKKAAKK